MGEEGTELKLLNHENDIKDIKKAEEKSLNRIIEIEKSNIRQETTLKLILETYNIIKYSFLAFIVSNLLMYFLKNK